MKKKVKTQIMYLMKVYREKKFIIQFKIKKKKCSIKEYVICQLSFPHSKQSKETKKTEEIIDKKEIEIRNNLILLVHCKYFFEKL